MADEIKQVISLEVKVANEKRIKDLQKEVDAASKKLKSLQAKVEKGDKGAIASAKSLNQQIAARTAEMGRLQKSVELYHKSQERARNAALAAAAEERRATAEVRRGADQATAAVSRKTRAQKRAAAEAERAAAKAAADEAKRQKAEADLKTRLESQRQKEAFKNSNYLWRLKLNSKKLEDKSNEDSAKKSKAESESLFKFRSRMESQRGKEQAKNNAYLQRLRLNSQREEERAAARAEKAEKAKALSIFNFKSRMEAQRSKEAAQSARFLDRLKVATWNREAREAVAEKRRDDARLRRSDAVANTIKASNQFMARHVQLMAYRGKIENEFSEAAQKRYRSARTAALLQFREDTRQAKARGVYDQAEEQRIKTRFDQRMKFATRDFNATMRIGRAEHMERMRLEREYKREVSSAATHTSAGFNRTRVAGGEFMGHARHAGYASIGAVGTAAAAAAKGISSRMDVDDAETSLKIFGSETGKDITSEKVNEIRKGWLDAESLKHGMSAADGLRAYTEVFKSGITNPEANTKNVMTGVTGLEMPLKETTTLMSTIFRNLGSEKATPERLKGVLNAIGIAAREDPTSTPQIVEGINRAWGALATGNLQPEDLPALVSGGQSVGIQPGKAGTFIATLTKQLSSGNAKSWKLLDPSVQKRLNFAAKGLGFTGGARGMAREYQADSKGTIYRVLETLKSLDPDMRTAVATALSGNQWNDEDLQIVNGLEGIQKTDKAINDPRNANFLEEANAKRMASWRGIWNQTRSLASLAWEKFGLGFDEIFRDVNAYFLALGTDPKYSFDALTGYVQEFLGGFKDALGIDNWKQLLERVLGPTSGIAKGDIGKGLRDFARGLMEGLIWVKDLFKSIGKGLGFDPKSIQDIGKLAGQFIGLSIALLALSPVLSVLGAATSAILALAGAARMAYGLAKFAGIIALLTQGGSLASIASGAAALAGWQIVGGMIAAGFVSYWTNKAAEKGAKVVDSVTGGKTATAINEASKYGTFGLPQLGLEIYWEMLKGIAGSVTGSDKPAGGAGGPVKDPETTGSITPQQKLLNKTNEHLEQLNKTQEGAARIQKQSFDASGGTTGFGGLIQKAAFIGAASVAGGLRAGGGTLGAGLSAQAPGFNAGQLGGTSPGSALGNVGIGGRGIIGGGRTSPGSGPGTGGGASGVSSGMVGYGANPGAYKGILDHIARSEGTAGAAGGGYNTSLGYGKFLPGGKEQNLTGKTLDEIDALQSGMLAHPGNGFNSSAIGRYQIVRKTLRGLRAKLGLKGSDLYDEAMQDRLGAELVRQRGANGSLGQEWASLRGGKLTEAIGLAGQIPKGASTTPGARPAGADGSAGNPADVGDRIRALKQSGAITNEQCVALAKAYVGATGSVTTWRRGEGAEQGNLKAGTPIATFLNRDGSPSTRYDGGGTGIMGNNTTHAGVFQEYIKDQAGKIIGMKVAEQFKGSGGPRMKDYFFGRGTGAKNGSNYHAILGPDGQPLGGSNNPMSQQSSRTVEAVKENSEAIQNMFGQDKMVDLKKAISGDASPATSTGSGGYIRGLDGKLKPYAGGRLNADGSPMGQGSKSAPNIDALTSMKGAGGGHGLNDLPRFRDYKQLKLRERMQKLIWSNGNRDQMNSLKERINDPSGYMRAKSDAETLVNPKWDGAGAGESGLGQNMGSKAPLGASAPISPTKTGGGAGKSGSTKININMHHQGNDPEAISSAVERKLSQSMGRRAHETEFGYG